MEDADMDMAVYLAAEGAYRNSGQRRTAVKRILVHEKIAEEFTQRLVEKQKNTHVAILPILKPVWVRLLMKQQRSTWKM